MNKLTITAIAFGLIGQIFAHEALDRPAREQYRVDKVLRKKAMPKLPNEHKDTLLLGTTPNWLIENDNGVLFAKKIRQLFPNTQFILSPVWFPIPGVEKAIEDLEAMGDVYYQQQHAPTRDIKNLATLASLPYNYRGDKLTGDNTIIATNPLHREYLNSKIFQAAKYGNNNFKAVDFVWPWTGRWGYDDATVNCFRDNLKGIDEGIMLTDKENNLYYIDFWDYFEYYHGLRFEPKDLGLTSWDEFFPTKEFSAARSNATLEEKRNLMVFIALYHYEHLHQNQRMGRAAKAIGGRHSATYNPEDFANGADYVFLLKLADFGTPFIEYFGSPVNTEGGFYHMGTYRRAADKAGKALGVIHELGQGGHGYPSVTPLSQYVQTYDVTSMGFDQYQNEWIVDSFADLMNPEKEYANLRWRTYLGGAYGYTQARDDKSRRSAAPVISVTQRGVNHYMDGWIWDIKSMDSFCRYFSPLMIDAEETDPANLVDVLPQSDHLFYTSPYTRRQDFAGINEWLKQGNKNLITHSYIPYSIANGIDYQLDAQSMAKAPLSELIAQLMKFPNSSADTVIYRGDNYTYADFLKNEIVIPFQTEMLIAPEFKNIKVENRKVNGEFIIGDKSTGKNINVQQYWAWTPENGQVIAKIGDLPLVTILKRADNSKIVYLHARLHILPEDIRQDITELIADTLALPVLGVPVKENPALLHAYKLADGGNAAILWDKKALEARGYYAGYRPLAEWTMENRYDHNIKGANGKANFKVAQAGKYRVLAMVSGREWVIDAAEDLTIGLALEDQLSELFYVGQDTPAWQTKINNLKQKREEMLKNVGNM